MILVTLMPSWCVRVLVAGFSCVAVPGLVAHAHAQVTSASLQRTDTAAAFDTLPPSGHGVVRTLRAVRIPSAIVIDGRLDEEAWTDVPIGEGFTQRDPDEGRSATEQTEIRVAYDDASLYVGIRLFDSRPSAVVRQLSRRDDRADADRITVYLDPFHDHLTGAMFEVSAAGVQRDALIYDDHRIDTNWNAVWYSAVGIDASGWTVEMRIPFSQLHFDAASHRQWGFNVVRYLHRRAEESWFELVPRGARWLASRMAHLEGIRDVGAPAYLELLPYWSTRASFLTARPGDPFNDGSVYGGNAGLDMKWSPTRSLTLTAAFRPDFGQVEVDPAVINLTTFETFFAEKRPFFLEGTRIFGSAAGDSLFYSRRIGRAPQGAAHGDFVDRPMSTAILAAGKLTGRSGGWTFGALNATTRAELATTETGGLQDRVAIEPLTNYLVGRTKWDGPRGGVGSMLTATTRQLRTEALGRLLPREAYAASGDGYVFLDARRDWRVAGEFAASVVRGDAPAILRQQESSRRYYQRPDASHVTLDPTATSLRGWRSRVDLARSSGTWRVDASLAATSPGFEINDLGFQNTADTIDGSVSLSWLQYEPNRWSRTRSLSVSKANRWNFNRDRTGDSWSIDGSVTFLNYWYVGGNVSLSRPTLDDRLTRGGPLAARVGERSMSATLGSDGRRRLSFYAGPYWFHDDAGSMGGSLSAGVVVKPASTLTISTGPTYYKSHYAAQYVAPVTDPLAAATFGTRYVFGSIDMRQASLTTRVDTALTPALSVQLYLEPFIGTGRYGDFKELARPRTFEFARYGVDQGTISSLPDGVYVVDPDGSGPATPFSIGYLDYNVKSLVSKAVLRWEWRPGSTLYVAWTQQRAGTSHAGDWNLSRDARLLFRGPADNVFLIKMSYWLGR
jgi:hypothetical protein